MIVCLYPELLKSYNVKVRVLEETRDGFDAFRPILRKIFEAPISHCQIPEALWVDDILANN